MLIVQIGANDGIQNDPLRKHLLKPGNYTAVLIEPLPFFIESLQKLYNSRNDIKIIQAAAGEVNGYRILYYIPNNVAYMMNGDGPDDGAEKPVITTVWTTTTTTVKHAHHHHHHRHRHPNI